MKTIKIILLFSGMTLLSCKQENALLPNNELEVGNTKQRYFDRDTVLIRKYTTDSGNEIEMRGSESKEVYRLKIRTKAGKQYDYQIADSWYGAAHSIVEWDNRDFIFIRQGCGTMCWTGKLLAVSGENKIREYPYYFDTDSIQDYIAFADAKDTKRVVIQNLKTFRKTGFGLDLCNDAVIPILAVDSVFKTSTNKILIRYTGENCVDKKEKIVELP